jgi:uncharacterized protein DUF3800
VTTADPSQAFVDESFHEAPTGGFYVLAAAMFNPNSYELVRATMRAILGKPNISKLHWNEMDAQQRRNAVKTVAGIDGFYVVTIGTPVPYRRQERARARCLRQLVLELHSYGVTHLLVESRTRQLNTRDVATVAGTRFQLPKGTPFRVDHWAGADEPLFWAADIVAGAVRAHREGQGRYRALLEECVYEVEVATSCGTDRGHA